MNYDELDPGIRQLVRILNEHGFCTTSSGDGSRPDTWAMRYPYVHITVDDSKDTLTETDRLVEVLAMYGVSVAPERKAGVRRPRCSVDYCCATMSGDITVLDVLDEDLQL